MAISNPAFGKNSVFSNPAAARAASQATNTATVQDYSAQQLNDLYNQPTTLNDREVMTVEDTLAKTAGTFGVFFVGAVISWIAVGASTSNIWLVIAGAIAGFVLGLVNSFKRIPVPGLVLGYAAAEGLFVGGFSQILETAYPGIAAQAVVATIVVFGVTLALFANGKIRASAKATKVFLIAMVGYLVFSLVNAILMITGVNQDAWGLRSTPIFGIPLGLILGVLVVIMCAYSLVLNFDSIQNGVKNRAPKIFAWAGAFGVVSTVVWLYIEILRIIAIARNN